MDKQHHKLRNGMKCFAGVLIPGIDESELVVSGDGTKRGCRETISAVVEHVTKSEYCSNKMTLFSCLCVCTFLLIHSE